MEWGGASAEGTDELMRLLDGDFPIPADVVSQCQWVSALTPSASVLGYELAPNLVETLPGVQMPAWQVSSCTTTPQLPDVEGASQSFKELDPLPKRASHPEGWTRFLCRFQGCGKHYASTDGVRKHCRKEVR